MPSLADVRSVLTILQIVAYVLLLRKLFVTELFQKYRYFGLLVAVEAARLPLMAAVPIRSDIYAYVYFATAPFIWMLYVLVVLEFFHIILRNHPGIATIGRKAVAVALGLSVVASAITLVFDLQQTSAEAALLHNFMLLERIVMTSLLVLLLSLIAFASHFPVPLAPNIRVHASIFAVYFTVRTAVFFLRLFFGLDVVVILNISLNLLAISCLLAWTVLLKPDGETAPVRRLPSLSEERLLAQLESINQSLMGSAKK
jgi:hypothetical protein